MYWVLSQDYMVHADTLQAVNLAMHDRFRERQIEFAYPTRTVLVQQAGGLQQ